MKRLRRHIVFTNLALIGVEVGVAFLVWFIFDGRQTFGPLNAYIIVSVSIIVASVAAMNSMFASVSAHDSLVTTQETLELTRNSIRPFLYISSPMKIEKFKEYRRLVINIKNSGSLPAEDVQMNAHFFGKNENVTERNVTRIYGAPEERSAPFMLFPNSDEQQNYIFDLKKAKEAKLWNDIIAGKTKCRIRIKYKSLGRKHKTIQTEEIAKREWEEALVIKPVPPQKWT